MKEDKIIQDEIINSGNINYPNRNIICDGIISEKLYFDSKYRIMWMLKEPYGKGDYKLGVDLLEPKRRQDVVNKIPAVRVMTYVTYSLLFNKLYEEINGLENNQDINNAITKIAWVNISKIPDTSESKKAEIEKHYKYWKDILFKQIKTYCPQILIFGGTFSHFEKDWKENFGNLPKRNKKQFSNYFFHYFDQDGMLIIAAGHPTNQYRRRQIRDYVNNILDIVNNKGQK
jgi:hypothetical protein